MRAKKIHPADAAHAARVATAVSFTAYLRLSPYEVLREDCPTQAAAEAAAKGMNAKSQHGRRAIIYAITSDGAAIPI